jgi:hypothetical protein
MTSSSDPDISRPAIMQPDLETWVRGLLGAEKFDFLRDRPLVAVALAAQAAEAEGGAIPFELWASFISTKDQEVVSSRRELLRMSSSLGKSDRDRILSLLPES